MNQTYSDYNDCIRCDGAVNFHVPLVYTVFAHYPAGSSYYLFDLFRELISAVRMAIGDEISYNKYCYLLVGYSI